MPTIRRIRENWRVVIYADDHAPPHFHVLGPECAAVFDMNPLELTRGTGPSHILREALEWASENIELLETKWSEINEHEK